MSNSVLQQSLISSHTAQRFLNLQAFLFGEQQDAFLLHETKDDAMRHYGIFKNSVLIIKRNECLVKGELMLCQYRGEPLVRKICERGQKLYLCISDGLEGCIPIVLNDLNVVGEVAWVFKEMQ